jgi:NAD(P)-dependent dehydrogenase (short-subunit alcohol dehydrogenase family)
LTQALLPLMRKSQHARIVNVSSGAGSHGDTAFGLTTGNSMGTSYAVAKAALNALTVKLANEEKVNRVLVNAVCPGFTATFEGGEKMGARPVKEGAASVVWAAMLPDDGPTGGFFRDGKTIPW